MHAEHPQHGKTIEQSIGDDLPCAADFFGGLKDQVDRTFEISAGGEIFGCSQQHCGVPVMSAGMHDARFG